MVDNPSSMISDVEDYREIESLEFRHATHYSGLANHSLSWGLDFIRQNAHYHYLGGAMYFGFTADYPGLENPVAYQITADPSGNSYAMFLSDRIEVSQQISVEVGLRWDRQTYTETTSGGQLSPRASLLFAAGGNQTLRLSVGRYYQAQVIQDLQVEDNIHDFHKPQFVDQFIAGYQWATESDYQFRVEAYLKNYGQVATRFENLFDPLQLGLAWQMDSWKLGIAGRIHTGWPETPLALAFDNETSRYYAQPGPRNSEQYGIFATLDLRLSKSFNMKKGHLTGFGEVINLTNRNNPCCVEYGSDVSWSGNHSLKQKTEYWLPILPSVGVLWEF